MPLKLTTLILRDNPRYCLLCFKKITDNSLHALFHKDCNICYECFKALAPMRKQEKINGVKGEFLFSYSNLLREKLYALKGAGDIEIAKAFLNYYLSELRIKYRGYYLIAAPSSEKSNQQRGFNHVVEIFKPLNQPFLNLLYKKTNYKQSNLNKSEREQVINKIGIKDINKIKGKKILLVDDVFTTGSTLKASLDLLKSVQPKKLAFLIIAKVNDLTIK